MGIQGVGEKCHFPEVSESLVLQHKLWGDNRKAGDPGEELVPELPKVRLLPLSPDGLTSIRVPGGAGRAALWTRARVPSGRVSEQRGCLVNSPSPFQL